MPRMKRILPPTTLPNASLTSWRTEAASEAQEVAQEIQSLISEKNECYNDCREKSDRLYELMTMQRNYQMAVQPQQPKRGHSHKQER